mmetsp:Transcript_54304/g.94773  ORF Transcript_54304/g.94773 Transcript_54304/m.94773 type:complete len:202 (-) Transcript_54304:1897-2502(-)
MLIVVLLLLQIRRGELDHEQVVVLPLHALAQLRYNRHRVLTAQCGGAKGHGPVRTVQHICSELHRTQCRGQQRSIRGGHSVNIGTSGVAATLTTGRCRGRDGSSRSEFHFLLHFYRGQILISWLSRLSGHVMDVHTSIHADSAALHLALWGVHHNTFDIRCVCRGGRHRGVSNRGAVEVCPLELLLLAQVIVQQHFSTLCM